MVSLLWSAKSQSLDDQLVRSSWITWQTRCWVTKWLCSVNRTSLQTAGSSWRSIVKRPVSPLLSNTPQVLYFDPDVEMRSHLGETLIQCGTFYFFFFRWNECRRRAEICLWRANYFERESRHLSSVDYIAQLRPVRNVGRQGRRPLPKSGSRWEFFK